MNKNFLWSALFCVVLYSCNGIQSIRNSVFKDPPYTRYIRSLEQANLDKSVMARTWIRAGEMAMGDSIMITLPFSESGYFRASEPSARSYQFNAREGQVLTINGAIVARKGTRCFLDLFHWENDSWKPLAHGDSTFNLTYEFNRDEQCLVRIQPELLVTAYYTIGISLTPVLINPVAGATNKSIGSLYGDARDGGKRKHEGIDIFAPKGTMVIAPTDGFISRVGNSNLGGKIVWMQDSKRGHSYYFAHLDSQFVKAGVRINKGTPIGTVGNTGNARYTPSHLHFGIYQSKSKDPVHYVRSLEAIVNALPWDTTFSQPDFKVVAKSQNLYAGPGEKHPYKLTLSKNTYVKVIAQSSTWYRVMLPDEQQGFIPKQKITPIQKGKSVRLRKATTLLSVIDQDSPPVAHLTDNSTVEVLATYEKFQYVRTTEGLFGWLVM